MDVDNSVVWCVIAFGGTPIVYIYWKIWTCHMERSTDECQNKQKNVKTSVSTLG